ncbi:ribosome-releasing factor 2, mitochondrial isoform X1 [Plutella xylostella]|uniref:ribosome-releasing factor 2, mitochondrial isoform X1 n=2 Tax=Plutella xylostella TaxID=51655 RepID=UPI0020327F75|nr:ribosome-releasing factor 2, mitochondrial isoform X1 [Plutella xylostella]
MKAICSLNHYRKLVRNAQLRRFSATSNLGEKYNSDNIRNIGILAHIDAGKTTTTERMLFYSGTIRSMGEVHHGNTVTDYMEQERQRGITITSAAVSFPWGSSQINLVDTPGHIDFTMEVEQSLAVLDGAVVVLDASAGVEAQTLTVWRQAAGYRVPRLLYLNKMDRSDADEVACVKSIEEKLDATPLLLHTPVRHEGKLIGLLDLLNLEEIIWTQGRGQKYTRRKLTEKEDGHVWENTMTGHRHLVDTLSSIDDNLADIIIQEESLDNIQSKDITAAIRRCTIDMKGFPIVCGSSYKNIGVQTLMDAVVDYLPSPDQCNELYRCFDKDLSARAFKVQHDDQRGVLTFLRLYSGEISKGQKIYNLVQDQSEQTGILYVALADEYKPVEKVTAGNIAVVSGLKVTMTRDLVTSNQTAANKAKTRLTARLSKQEDLERLILPSARQRLNALDEQPDDSEKADILLGIGARVPEPVFLCTIEPPSVAFQTPLETALAELSREDPSLRVVNDDESGQIVLAGMGELHLEIIKERIIREYKIDVELGPLQIAYRETLLGAAQRNFVLERKIGSQKQMVNVTMSAKTVKGVPADKVLRLNKSPESAANLAHVWTRHMTAVKQGVSTALLHGPKLGCKMVDVQVTLHWLEVGRGTSDSVVSAAVVQCLRKVFAEAESILLEPVMSLEVVVPESHSARVLADLTRRRADLQQVHVRRGDKVIECLAPLSELLGYSSALRSLSSGLASFTMEFHSNRQMTPYDEEKAIKAVTGF